MADVRDLTRQHFAALERGATGETLAGFYEPAVVQEEFPNRLAPNGVRRDLTGIFSAAERGRGSSPGTATRFSPSSPMGTGSQSSSSGRVRSPCPSGPWPSVR